MKEDKLLSKLKTDFEFVKKWKDEQTATEGAADVARKIREEYFNKLVAYRRWYEGDQWSVYPDGTLMDTTNDVIKPTINLIKIIIDQQHSLLKRRKMICQTRPVEQADIVNARAIEDVVKFVWKQKDIQAAIAAVDKDSLIYGAGFLKTRWTEENDLSFDIINPLNFYPDKYGNTIDEMRYVVIALEKTAEYIRYKYDKEESADDKGRVVVYESWYNHSIDFPKGLYALWTDNQILKQSTLDDVNPAKNIPICAFIHNKMSNSFWGISEVKNLAEVQLIHNKTLGFILDNLALTNNCEYITTDDKFAKDGLINRPGSIHLADDLNNIKPLPQPMISPQWFSILSYSGYGLMQQISGTYAVNLGGASQTDTASGIIALQQAGGAIVESNFQDVAKECKRLVKIILSYLYAFKKNNLLDMTDEEVDFNKINLDRDIFIEFSDAYPEDKVTRINMFVQMMQLPPDKLKIIAQLMGDVELLEYATQAEKQAQEMQQMMLAAQGQQAKGGGNA